MRILHISSAKTWQGGERQIVYLLEELSQHSDQQHYLLCPTDSPLHSKVVELDVEVHSFTKVAPANPLVSKKVASICKLQGIDLIHAHDPHSLQYLYWSIRWMGNSTAAVVSRRVALPISSFAKQRYDHPTIKKIICVSRAVSDYMRTQVSNEKKVVYIPSGTHIPAATHTKARSLKALLGIDKHAKLVVNVGAISKLKNQGAFVDLAEALIKRADETKQLHFVMIGADGGQRHAIENKIRLKNLGNSISFSGELKLEEYWEDIDILVSTSTSEGMPNAIMEAMAHEVLVLAIPVGGIAELIQDGVTGLLGEADDIPGMAEKLNNLLKSEALQTSLVENASNKILEYSKERMASRTLSTYLQALNTH